MMNKITSSKERLPDPDGDFEVGRSSAVSDDEAALRKIKEIAAANSRQIEELMTKK